ncbi:hypothetical protein MHYP_G00037860 [Metynnis hypsauchen]
MEQQRWTVRHVRHSSQEEEERKKTQRGSRAAGLGLKCSFSALPRATCLRGAQAAAAVRRVKSFDFSVRALELRQEQRGARLRAPKSMDTERRARSGSPSLQEWDVPVRSFGLRMKALFPMALPRMLYFTLRPLV